MHIVPNGPEDVFTANDDETTPGTTPNIGDTTPLRTISTPPTPSTPYKSPHREHFVPATPQRLARLADINADLEDRIEVLNEQIREDAEVSNARVRRLEKEIANLRAELSYTCERNEQLEAARQRDEEEEQLAKELRRQRTENLRAARQRRLTHGIGSIGSHADLAEQAAKSSSQQNSRIMDFAPKTTLADLKRILGRAEGTVNYEGERPEQDDEDAEDDRLVESPTTLVGSSSNVTSKKNTDESLLFLEQLTGVERATLMRHQSSQSSSSPVATSDPHLEPSQSITPPTRSPYSTINFRSAGLSKGTRESDPPTKATADATLRGSGSRSGSLRLKKGHHRGSSVQRVALGNKAMLSMSSKATAMSPSKGKSRASLTSMSFVPPDSTSNEDAEVSTMNVPVIIEGSPSSSITPSPSFITEPITSTPKPSSILSSNLLKSPLHNFSFLNTISPDASLRSRLGMTIPGALDNIDAPTLKSEILGSGQDLHDDWRADFEQKLFGDFDIAELMSSKGDGAIDSGERHSPGEEADIDVNAATYTGADTQGGTIESAVAFGSSAAMDALSAALDPMRRGEPRDPDDHILPLGSLRDAPVEAFYLLDKAVAARPSAWTNTTSGGNPSGRLALEDSISAKGRHSPSAIAQQKQKLLNLPIEFPTLRIREDAWSLYPDEDDVADDASDDAEPPPPGAGAPHQPQLIKSPIIRRERALNRMQLTRHHRLSSSGVKVDSESPGPSSSHRHGHRHRHRRDHGKRQESQSILKNLAQRIGVPTALIPYAITGREDVAEADETGEETEVEERSVVRVSSEPTDDNPLPDREDGEGQLELSNYRGIKPNSSLLRRTRDGNGDAHDDRYNASAIAKKLQNSSIQTIVQVWMTVQFAALVVVFVYYAAKRGPTAILNGSRRGGRDAPRIRSGRGAGGFISRRQ